VIHGAAIDQVRVVPSSPEFRPGDSGIDVNNTSAHAERLRSTTAGRRAMLQWVPPPSTSTGWVEGRDGGLERYLKLRVTEIPCDKRRQGEETGSATLSCGISDPARQFSR
jgi:hypothetical protein